MQQKINFIIIDDSKEDCYLIKKRLETLDKNFNIKSFLSAQEAYDYINHTGINTPADSRKNIIILDIYMPLMDGFEFVEEFETLPKNVQDNYLICALTSSINKIYIDKISTYNSVKYFLEKPIKTESLLDLIEG
ncbi:response regulator [Mucilaginibacter arboris]|uniref:Response regulator n=1 Tax=Mucilaginibacter arboris TaxID=2682090 RepID=A0A7K1SVD2_9SPHI|nr:response regulator [Mucilaginibacter arboris]MVN21243.1 response regulator [Mucilaginibacter arboris]